MASLHSDIASQPLWPSTADFLTDQIADPETQWSLGTFGAIAEFTRDPDEPVTLRSLSAVTARGAIRLSPRDDIRLFAFETITRDSWSPRVAICLPRDASTMSRRTVLTELGPDRDAARPEDRDGILFDVGIGAWQVDVCIRVSDPAVAAEFRAQCGRATFGPDSVAGKLLLRHSPHRVFVSRLGRAEVFQPIPPPDGKSPDGPHTHVLPSLLRHRRTHAATEPIPEGFVPCAHLYPAHPAKDARGMRRPFDPKRKAAFDLILRAYGDPRFLEIKEQVSTAVADGADPLRMPLTGRFARTNIRIVLRQMRAENEDHPSLPTWFAAHDTAALTPPEDDEHIHHR